MSHFQCSNRMMLSLLVALFALIMITGTTVAQTGSSATVEDGGDVTAGYGTVLGDGDAIGGDAVGGAATIEGDGTATGGDAIAQ